MMSVLRPPASTPLPTPRRTRTARVAWLVALVAGACANPVPPTGGPVDRTPPRLVAATPSNGALGVADGTLRLTFSEALDEGTAARAVSVTPDTDTPLRVEASGRTVVVRLGALRPNTTYVVTFDTSLRDLRGVPLASPLAFAFSTGPTLDRGTLAGRVVDGPTGAPRGGIDVLAWPSADTLRGDSAFTARPIARTQTATDGTFRFAYLGRAPLFVAAVEDRNRNRRIDAGEAVAAPPAPALVPTLAPLPTASDSAASPSIPPDPAGTDTVRSDSTALLLWRLARPDATAPRPDRVRAIAATRLAVRFTEPVRLPAAPPSGWNLVDTTGAEVPILTVWTPTPAPVAGAASGEDAGGGAGEGTVFAREVMVETPALALRPHRLTTGAALDSAGNVARAAVLRVVPVASPDTLRLRILGQVPADGRLVPGETFALVLSRPMGADSARVAVLDTLGRPLPHRLVADASGTRIAVGAAPPFDVRLDARDGSTPDSARRVTAFDARDLGGLTGRVEHIDGAAAGSGPVVVVAEGGGRRFVTRAGVGGAFAFTGLPAGAYRLSAWHDRDADGRWTPGALRPWRAAEALVRVEAPVTVRARWDTDVPDPVRL